MICIAQRHIEVTSVLALTSPQFHLELHPRDAADLQLSISVQHQQTILACPVEVERGAPFAAGLRTFRAALNGGPCLRAVQTAGLCESPKLSECRDFRRHKSLGDRRQAGSRALTDGLHFGALFAAAVVENVALHVNAVRRTDIPFWRICAPLEVGMTGLGSVRKTPTGRVALPLDLQIGDPDPLQRAGRALQYHLSQSMPRQQLPVELGAEVLSVAIVIDLEPLPDAYVFILQRPRASRFLPGGDKAEVADGEEEKEAATAHREEAEGFIFESHL